jgi:N,N'-diacetylchitobiose transport system permease protein
VLLNVIGLVVIVLFAFPFYWMLSTAFKQPADVQTYVPKFLPIPPTLDNFATAVTRPYFPDYVRNSVVVSISTVLLALVVGLLAGIWLRERRRRTRGETRKPRSEASMRD